MTVCIYCYELKLDKIACCEENHFEEAIEINDQIFLLSEVVQDESL